MIPTRPIQTRYATTSRRTLARQAALAALIVVPGVACGNNDAEVFESATTETVADAVPQTDSADTTVAESGEAATTVPTTSAETTIAPTDTAPADTAPTDTASNDTSTASATFPESAELAVSFSYVAESTNGRGIENPYIAVWVEDLDGNLVQTISLWYEQSGEGDRWLSDLPQWYAASGQGSDVTMSGATQVAGDYTVVWDGTGLDGALVPAGEYVLYVEAAREHGPYGITSEQITIGADAFTVPMSDNGELLNLTASLIA